MVVTPLAPVVHRAATPTATAVVVRGLPNTGTGGGVEPNHLGFVAFGFVLVLIGFVLVLVGLGSRGGR